MTIRTRSGRGRTPSRRDPDDRAVDGNAFVDLIDELPGQEVDLEYEIRQMGLSASSGAFAQRRRS